MYSNIMILGGDWMAYSIITRCPVCNEKLVVERLKCKKCGTVVENEFQLSKLSYLGKEQLKFIEVFLQCRGNIKDVEKELGISYPTVRAKLDEVILAMGFNLEKKSSVNSTEVIDKLEKGEISAEEAVNLLKE